MNETIRRQDCFFGAVLLDEFRADRLPDRLIVTFYVFHMVVLEYTVFISRGTKK
jgi:hypothetical protein